MQSPEESPSNLRPPLAPYAVLSAFFWGAFFVLLHASRSRLSEQISIRDLIRVGLASYQLSHVTARDKIAIFVRAPFAEGPAAVQPKGGPLTRPIGELVTCPHCLALWLSAAFSFGLIRFPRETRLATTVFAAHGLADLFLLVRARLRQE